MQNVSVVKNYSLMLPTTGYEVTDREEMSYIDGGFTQQALKDMAGAGMDLVGAIATAIGALNIFAQVIAWALYGTLTASVPAMAAGFGVVTFVAAASALIGIVGLSAGVAKAWDNFHYYWNRFLNS